METKNRSDLRDGEPGGAGSQACELARFPTRFSGARGSSQVGQRVGARPGAGGRLAGSHRLGATLSLEEEPTAKTCPEPGPGLSEGAQAAPRQVPVLRQDGARQAGEGSFLASPMPPLKQPQTGTEGLTPTGGRTGQEREGALARRGGAGRGELGWVIASLSASMPSEAAVRPRPGPAPRRGSRGHGRSLAGSPGPPGW